MDGNDRNGRIRAGIKKSSTTSARRWCNAAKFGALSAPSGRIELVGRLGAGDLGLVWREDGGPPVQPPAHRGFGTTLLTEIFAQDGGQVEFDWRREGLVCSIQVRLMTPEP